MQAKNKAKVKAVYDFVKKATKPQKKTFEVYPGVKSKVEYWLTFDGNEWGREIDSETITLPKQVENMLKVLYGEHYDPDYNETDIDYDKFIDTGDTETQFTILAAKAGLEPDDYEWFDDVPIYDTTWEVFWENFSSEFEDPTSIKIAPIRLNNAYTAVINKKDNTVQVGCQTIPIDAVRKIVKEFDRVS